MIGILSAGGYVPRYRLSGQALGAVWGGGGSGERAVAGYDEDSLTMACEAALNALHGPDVTRIGACFLASTSAPYAEKSSAAILATVADLAAAVLTADLDTVKACSAAQALVAAGDVRPVAPGTPEEAQLGDGAGAALVGDGNVIASFEGAFAASHDFTDVWRLQGDRYLSVLLDVPFVRPTASTGTSPGRWRAS
jgi:hydroxymethylglutaryl-CoA synthase